MVAVQETRTGVLGVKPVEIPGAKYAKSANSGGQNSGTVKDEPLKFNVLEAIEGNYLG